MTQNNLGHNLSSLCSGHSYWVECKVLSRKLNLPTPTEEEGEEQEEKVEEEEEEAVTLGHMEKPHHTSGWLL